MFARLSTLALLLPFAAAAITINAVSNVPSTSVVTVKWTASTNDPQIFDLYVYHPNFNSMIAVANNVPTANGMISFQFPVVPIESGYHFLFADPTNSQTTYATSNQFDVISASSTSSASASSSTDSLSSSSAATSTPSTSDSTTSTAIPTTTTTTGTTSASPSTFKSSGHSGAGSFKLAGFAPAAALVLSAVAGAAMVF